MSETALEDSKLAAQHGIDLSKLPKFLDMSAETITQRKLWVFVLLEILLYN